MTIRVEPDLCSGLLTVSRERSPQCITVTAGDYHVVVRDGVVIIESSTTTGWSPVARSIGPEKGRGVVAAAGDVIRTYQPDADTAVIEMLYTDGPHRVVTLLTVSSRGPLLRVDACDAITGEAEVSRFGMEWEFLNGPPDGSRPDFIFTPGLAPEEGQIVGQHLFRSPAAIVQHNEVAFALIPDVNEIDAHQPLRMFLDVQSPVDELRPVRLSTGVAAYELDGHVYFTTKGVAPVGLKDTVLRFSAEICVDALIAEFRGHQPVARYHWRRNGRRWLQSSVKPQTVPFATYYEYGYSFAERHLWREAAVDGRRVGAMMIQREYDGDVWFQGWFNQLRTAYGYYLLARRHGHEDRMQRALATRDLVLSAPQPVDGPVAGLFSTIAVLPEQESGKPVTWVESTLQGGGPGLYHLLDSSWTATWLVRWHTSLTPDDRIVRFCRRYADALLRLQKSNGGWPDYVDARTGETVTEFDHNAFVGRTNSGYLKGGMATRWDTRRFATSAESAANVLFLAELSRILDDGQEYLDAAQRGANFLIKTVIPRHKWFDWETFFSCSPKPIDFYDGRTNQHPQNTMSLFFAADALRVLYDISGGATLGEQALSLIDYLCLYQQVWSPPFLSTYGFGGFGAMNTDGEWHDARQAVFSDGLAMQYLQSGRQEYLERAVAATRASFACMFIPENAGIAPKVFDRQPTGYADENYGHGGFDTPAGASGFDWGTGSALTAAALLLDTFGDLWIDVLEGWALGIDGLTVTECRCEAGTWHIEVNAPFGHTDRVIVKGSPCEYESGVRLVVNGLEPVAITDDQLIHGVEVRIR